MLNFIKCLFHICWKDGVVFVFVDLVYHIDWFAFIEPSLWPWDRSTWSWCISSAGKISTCNAGDPSLIPGSGRSPEEGIGCPLQYSWASLVAQTVKNPLAMRETWVQPMGWEGPLEEGMATHSSALAWRIPMDKGAWRAAVHRVTKSRTQLSD